MFWSLRVMTEMLHIGRSREWILTGHRSLKLTAPEEECSSKWTDGVNKKTGRRSINRYSGTRYRVARAKKTRNAQRATRNAQQRHYPLCEGTCDARVAQKQGHACDMEWRLYVVNTSDDSLLVHIYLYIFTEPPYFPPSTKQSLFNINERFAP